MKKRALLIFTIALICLFACVFCACNQNDIPEGVPIGWQTYLEEVVTFIVDDIDECQDVVNCSLTGSMVVNGNYYELIARANYDDTNYDASNFALALKDSDGESKFSILSDNKDTYIDISQNPYVDNAKLKLQETNIFDWLGSLSGQDGSSFTKELKNGFIELGKIIFNSADVNADRSKYTFGINGDGIGSRLYAYFQSLTVVDKNIGEVIKNILGIKNTDEMFSALSSVQGKVNFHLNNGSVERIDTDGLKFDSDADSSIQLNMSINDVYDESLKQLFPQSDFGYKVTKVGSTSLDGTMSLISSKGDKYAVKYDMSMNTNLDLLKLTFNNFDLEKLTEDNFFHFRLSHKCDDECTEYCTSRLQDASGAVLDIAFSPQHFGTSNVYICYNLRAFLRKEYVEQVARYDRSVSVASIPEYGMIVIPSSNLQGNNAFTRMLFQSYSLIMGIDIGQSVVVDIGDIGNSFADTHLASALMDNMLVSEEFNIDTLKIKINQNIYGQAREYDIFKEVVYLKDYDESGVKSFETPLGKDYSAYSWKYEEKKAVNSQNGAYSLNNIYDISGENLLHGVNESGEYVPMSDKEIEDIIGSALRLDYVGYGGTENTAYCEIVGVEGLDANCFDVQEVTLKVKYPNLLDYTFEFADIAEKVLEDLFGGGSEIFVQDVKASIKLTRERNDNAFDFISADTNAKYRLTYNTAVPEMLKATAIIRYENGLQKEISTIGESDSVIISMGLFSKQYSITEWGKVTVRFRVAGRSVERYFDVEPPDDFEFTTRDASGEIGNSCYITNCATLKAVYGQDKVTVKLSLKDFYINNISLDNPASDWEHYSSYTSKNLVFTKSNDYTVSVRKCGIDFGNFILHISSTATRVPTYQYNSKSEPQSVVLKDARNSFSGTIVNKTHGDGEDEEYKVDVKVYEYYASSYGLSYKEADVSTYSLELSVDGVNAENGQVSVVLPSLIVNPISVRTYIQFSKAGIYRVVIRLNSSTVYQYTITVL